MPNGKPGDHPITDIVVHGRDVYSPKAASLVREIVKLADVKTRNDLADVLMRDYNDYGNPDVPKLERYLTELRDRLVQDAKQRGFEL
jgi:hypothetical protein